MSKDWFSHSGNMTEMWEERFKQQWKPSHGALPVSDQNLIKDLLMILRYWVENEKQIDLWGHSANPLNVLNELNEDGIPDRLELIHQVSRQIEEHKRLWETAGKQTGLPTYETGFWLSTKELFSYFKFQIKSDGPEWRIPKKVKRILITYHRNRKGLEIEIETKKANKK